MWSVVFVMAAPENQQSPCHHPENRRGERDDSPLWELSWAMFPGGEGGPYVFSVFAGPEFSQSSGGFINVPLQIFKLFMNVLNTLGHIWCVSLWKY